MTATVNSVVTGNREKRWVKLVYDQSRWNKKPKGLQNISIVIRYVNKVNKIWERLIAVSSTENGDAEIITGLNISELAKVWLSTNKTLTQVHDGAFVMPGKVGGAHQLFHKRWPCCYVNCLRWSMPLEWNV